MIFTDLVGTALNIIVFNDQKTSLFVVFLVDHQELQNERNHPSCNSKIEYERVKQIVLIKRMEIFYKLLKK